MKVTVISISVLIAAFVILYGCTSSQKQSVTSSQKEKAGSSENEVRKGKVQVPDPRWIEGESREWWDIFKLDFEGDRKVRTKVGYLYRKYGKSNRKGYYWVKDLAQTDVGFLTPDLTAYRIIYSRTPEGELETHKLTTNTLNAGVKAIMGIKGTMELKKVIPSPSGTL